MVIFLLLFFFLDKKEPKNQDLLDLSGYSSRKKRTQPKLAAPKPPSLPPFGGDGRSFEQCAVYQLFTLRFRRQF